MRARLTPAVAAVLVLLAGLAARAGFDGAFAKYAGVVLYATFALVLVLVIAPRTPPWPAAGIALAWCWGVEFAQLTPWPAALSARSGLARLVLGSTFNAPDLLAYLAGIGVPLGVVLLIGRRRVTLHRRTHHQGGRHPDPAGLIEED